jgi:hypothetical protein
MASVLLAASTIVAAQNAKIEPAPLPADTSVKGENTGAAPADPQPSTSATNTASSSQPSQMMPCIRSSNSSANGDVTYHKGDLIGAGEGVFGKGANGLGQMIERILRKQGEPNAYIAGHEAAGAFVVGLRYGSGALCHKVEGQRPAFWTGPSLGFDAGADATKVFVLVYNLYDSQDLYKRYGEVEGRAYYVGGLSATYLRRGNVVMIPVRLGVGLRLGANFGYMKFSEKGKWFPF